MWLDVGLLLGAVVTVLLGTACFSMPRRHPGAGCWTWFGAACLFGASQSILRLMAVGLDLPLFLESCRLAMAGLMGLCILEGLRRMRCFGVWVGGLLVVLGVIGALLLGGGPTRVQMLGGLLVAIPTMLVAYKVQSRPELATLSRGVRSSLAGILILAGVLAYLSESLVLPWSQILDLDSLAFRQGDVCDALSSILCLPLAIAIRRAAGIDLWRDARMALSLILVFVLGGALAGHAGTLGRDSAAAAADAEAKRAASAVDGTLDRLSQIGEVIISFLEVRDIVRDNDTAKAVTLLENIRRSDPGVSCFLLMEDRRMFLVKARGSRVDDLESAPRFEQAVTTAFAGRPGTHLLPDDLGRWHLVSLHPLPVDESGRVPAVVGVEADGLRLNDLVGSGGWIRQLDGTPFLLATAPPEPPPSVPVAHHRLRTAGWEVVWPGSARPEREQRLLALLPTLGLALLLIVFHEVIRLRREAAQEVAISERRFRGIVESQVELLVRFDACGQITFANPAAERTFGTTLAHDAGKPILKWFHPEDAPLGATSLGRLLTGDTTQEAGTYRMLTPEGIRWIQWESTRVGDLGPECEFQGVGRDVTDRVTAEAQAHLLSQAIEASPGAVVLLDRKGVVTWVNRGFVLASGWDAAAVVGRRPWFLRSRIHPKGFHARIVRTVAGRGVWHGELCNRRRDGSEHWVVATIAPVLDDLGAVTSHILVMEDIEEAKRREAELARARVAAEAATKVKSEFLSTISHELRTPLNGVVGMADLLTNTALDGDQREFVRIVRDCAGDLLHKVTDILDFTRLDSGRMELEECPFDPLAMVEEAAAMLVPMAQPKGLLLLVHGGPGLPPELVGDRHRFQQVVLNLLANAVKFTERGWVAVELSGQMRSDGRCVLTLVVRDSGIGMSEEIQRILFEPFSQGDGSTTRRFGGTGLGLAICQRLLRRMDPEATISVSSRPHSGSVFTFHLALPRAPGPVVRPQPLAHRVVAAAAPAGPALDSLAGSLASLGVVVTRCPTLAAALASGLPVVLDLALADPEALPPERLLLLVRPVGLTDPRLARLPGVTRPLRQGDLVAALSGEGEPVAASSTPVPRSVRAMRMAGLPAHSPGASFLAGAGDPVADRSDPSPVPPASVR